MIGHGVASRSSYSDAAGRTTSAAKPWTQSRMSRWSSERSRLKGTGSSGTGSSIGVSGAVSMGATLGCPPPCFRSLRPRPPAQTSCAGDNQELEARLRVVEVLAEELAQLVEAVAHGLRMHVDGARDVRDAAVVLEPGAEGLEQPGAGGGAGAGERGQAPIGELGQQGRVTLDQQRREVVLRPHEPVRPGRSRDHPPEDPGPAAPAAPGPPAR